MTISYQGRILKLVRLRLEDGAGLALTQDSQGSTVVMRAFHDDAMDPCMVLRIEFWQDYLSAEVRWYVGPVSHDQADHHIGYGTGQVQHRLAGLINAALADVAPAALQEETGDEEGDDAQA